jgi:hypothetical protein
MDEETLEKLSKKFCNSFHRQKWDLDCEEPSEINKTAWKNCVKDLIEEYLRIGGEQSQKFN